MPPHLADIAATDAIIADIRAGKMVILVDEEDRENEGDLVMAAEHATPETINFMAKFGRGLICLTPVSYTHLDVYKRQTLPCLSPSTCTST